MSLEFPELQKILGVVGQPLLRPSLVLSAEGLVRPQIVGSGSYQTFAGVIGAGSAFVTTDITADGVYLCRWNVIRTAGVNLLWKASIRDKTKRPWFEIQMFTALTTGSDLEENVITYLEAGWDLIIQNVDASAVGDTNLVRSYAQLLIM